MGPNSKNRTLVRHIHTRIDKLDCITHAPGLSSFFSLSFRHTCVASHIKVAFSLQRTCFYSHTHLQYPKKFTISLTPCCIYFTFILDQEVITLKG